MIINKIIIKNFKGISDKVITTENKPLYAFAPNGSGKTSFLEALRFGLTGKMPKDMLHHGTTEGSVMLVFNDSYETVVERRFFEGTKPNQVKLNGKTTTSKEAQKIICEIMNMSEEKLDVFTSHDLFSDLINGDLASFLLGFISEPFTLEKLFSLVEFTDEEKEKIKIDKLLPNTFEISDITSAYQNLFTERTNLKKELASLNAKYNFEEELPTPKFASEEEMKKEEEKWLLTKTADKELKNAMAIYNKSMSEYRSRVCRKEELERKIKELEDKGVVPVDESSITKEEASVEEKRSLISTAEKLLASSTTILSSQKKVLAALDSDICPISSCLICKTDKTKIKDEIVSSIADAEKNIFEAKETIASVIIEKGIVETKIKTLKNGLKAWQDYLNLKKRFEDIEVGSEPTKPEAKEISESSALFPIYKKEFEEYLDWSAAKETLVFLQNKIALCVSLLDKFAPKGVVNVSIMKHYCDIFDEEAGVIADLFGYYISFVPENGVKLNVIPKGSGKEIVEFSSLSRGEKLITSIIIYAVLNSLMGSGLIILDNLNDLDEKSQETAKAIINSLYTDLYIQNIFIAGC